MAQTPLPALLLVLAPLAAVALHAQLWRVGEPRWAGSLAGRSLSHAADERGLRMIRKLGRGICRSVSKPRRL
jgi:hypothetical protein